MKKTFAIIFILPLLLFSCGKKIDENSLVGTWTLNKKEYLTVRLSINKNQTFTCEIN